MSDNILVTPGSGATVATDDVSAVHYQKIKLDIGGDGVSKPVLQGGTDGVPVDVLSGPATGLVTKPLAGQTWPISAASAVPVSDNSGSITVDAPVGTPVFVRISSGSVAVDTLPVSGTVAVTQSTPAAVASGWPIKITDGTDTVGISTVSATKALKVDVVQTVGSTAAIADRATYTQGTSLVGVIGGEYNDSPTGPSSGQAAAVRITSTRAMQVNLRKEDGTELGIAATPLRVDVTGSTTQPVSGTVTANLKDNAGTAYSATNPLYVSRGGRAQTRVTKSVAITASQTAVALWTPASGKKFYITKIILTVSVTGTLTLFDSTNAAANLLLDGTLPTGVQNISFEEPWASSTADNILKYTSGSGMTGVFTAHGFEV